MIFKALVENQSEHKIKCLRSDRGGEYTAFCLQSFLKENVIHHQLTASYTPQQNGVAERKNRTLGEMARCMLQGKRLPEEFWAEAIACAAYLINRTSTKSVNNMTPQEAWSGLKPGVGHLKVLGCIAYAHVPDQRRRKLDQKSEKTVFVGYSENTKAYKLYNPVTKKVIISKDVIFDEAKAWNEPLRSEENSPHISVSICSRKESNEEGNEMNTHTHLSMTTQNNPSMTLQVHLKNHLVLEGSRKNEAWQTYMKTLKDWTLKTWLLCSFC